MSKTFKPQQTIQKRVTRIKRYVEKDLPGHRRTRTVTRVGYARQSAQSWYGEQRRQGRTSRSAWCSGSSWIGWWKTWIVACSEWNTNVNQWSKFDQCLWFWWMLSSSMVKQFTNFWSFSDFSRRVWPPDALRNVLRGTNPRYIRCIKPNGKKQAG